MKYWNNLEQQFYDTLIELQSKTQYFQIFCFILTVVGEDLIGSVISVCRLDLILNL